MTRVNDSNDPTDSSDGRGGLRAKLADPDPPAALEARVRETLTAHGLVRQQPSRVAVWAARAGLIAAGFLLGLLFRGAQSVAPQPTADGQYVLLLYGDPADDTGSVHTAREREYGRWASSLPNDARWTGGNELGDIILDIPPAGNTPLRNDRLAGYFVISASSRESAVRAARSTPHLAYGGRVVLMAVEP